MEKIFDFLKKYQNVAFATVGEDFKPKIRAFQIMKFGEDRLYFVTSTQKQVYQQLRVSPFIELLSKSGNISVRVSGKVSFDVTDETEKEIYDENPVLQRLYENYKKLVYFYVEIEKADYYDLSANPPIFESYIPDKR